MPLVRNQTGEDRYVPEVRRTIPADGVMDIAEERLDAWETQPGWTVESPVKIAKKGKVEA